MNTERWFKVGSGEYSLSKRNRTLDCDVLVIGAGMAGISAAVSAARNGSSTILLSDRSVIGGNASSEIRVTINGVKNLERCEKVERETGIIEEVQIENWYYNPQESYPVFDHVLLDYVNREKNLKLLLDTRAIEPIMDGDKISSVIAMQSTTELIYNIHSKTVIDCSGDGLIAALSGAEYRTGRESKDEFDESFAPKVADNWVMGDTLMLITKDMGEKCPYNPPSFKIDFKANEAFDRDIVQLKEGFWWVEIADKEDIISNRDNNTIKIMGYMHGVWDYIKNSGKFPNADNLALDWVGSIPGRRESRRFIGDYILNQKDMENYIIFDDCVAYGGWSLDEHCPGGIENLKDSPSFFHSEFRKPYGIPYRCLYSKNIRNLMFAGRNISVTHIALSSTRIIATCALTGQAAGTAAAICSKYGIIPRELGTTRIKELQEQLIRDDCYLPSIKALDSDNKVKIASISTSTLKVNNLDLLTDGFIRDEINDEGFKEIHYIESIDSTLIIDLKWANSIDISSVELSGDTDLYKKICMHKNPEFNKGQHISVPPQLIKDLKVEALIENKWKIIGSIYSNLHRKISIDFDEINTTSLRICIEKNWGAETVKLYDLRVY